MRSKDTGSYWCIRKEASVSLIRYMRACFRGPAAPPGQASLESKGPICKKKKDVRGMSLLETSSS